MLADFDVARVSGGNTTMSMTPGTEPFVAPEVRKTAKVSPASDMFSFGITMLRVLVPDIWDTRMPKTTAEVIGMFDGTRDDDALSKHLLRDPLNFAGTGAADAASGSASAAEAEDLKLFCDVITKLLHADPGKRPSAAKLLDHAFFESVRLIEVSKEPTSVPRLLGGGACKVYTATHGGEQALADPTWEQSHFSQAAVQFHLMMGSQTNDRVREVLICVNDQLTAQFESKREALRREGKPDSEIWIFHGTGSQTNVDAIVTNGFVVPPAGRETNGAVHGRGIYGATGPNTPVTYARGTRQLLLCRSLPGREGQRESPGVDMWRPRLDWVVFADAASLLPVYVIKY